MEIESRSDRIRATSAGKTADVRLGDWSRVETPAEQLGNDDRPTLFDRVVQPDGAVELPAGGAAVIDANGNERRVSCGVTETVTPEETVVASGPIPTLVRPSETATLSVDNRDAPTLSLPDGATVTIGWQRPAQPTVGSITVDPTRPASVAAGIAAASVALPSVTHPGRTWPNSRSAAPTLTSDPSGRDPESVDRIDTEVEIELPDDLQHVLASASLVYYLGAKVSVGSGTTETRLRAAGNEWSLGSSPEAVDRRASAWLRRVFYLDCLARAGGPNGVRLREADDALAYVDGSASELYETPLADRVARYLDADAAVEAELPRWGEVVHVASDNPRERVPRLSRWLGRLADVRLADGDQLSLGELDTWEPEPGVAVRGASSAVPETMIVPAADGEAGVVGWDAPGTPLGAYDASVGAPVSPEPRDDDPVEVVVVRCGWQSAEKAADWWRARSKGLEMTVSTRSDPTTEQLREILCQNVDLVHLAAHNERNEGIECADGYLSAHELREVGATAVVANCCGATEWAKRAVDAGAATAAAPTGRIETDVAESEGADLAGLLSLGWCVERAADVVRHVRDQSGWLVVGDGGTRVGQSRAPTPARVVEREQFQISHLAPGAAGHRISDVSDCGPRLPGAVSVTSERDELLSRLDSPVLDSERLVWPSTEI